MPWPTFLWLNAFSYFWSQLRAYVLEKAFSEPQPWPGEGSSLVLPRLPVPSIAAFSHHASEQDAGAGLPGLESWPCPSLVL